MARVVIAAGGTGGHFYPGLVLAKTLKARGWEPLFIVRVEDPALSTLEREGIAAVEVDLKGLPRSLTPELATFGWKLGKSLLLLRRVLGAFRPDVAVGMGGYLTAPLALAAKSRRVPLVVHDSNAVLGQANKLAHKLGAKLFWGLPPVSGEGKVIGTPIRPALWKVLDRAEACRRLELDAKRTTILVFGGSQGGKGLNREAPPAIKNAANAAPNKLQVLHLTGEKEFAEVKRAYEGAPLVAKVLPRTDAMEAAYAACDLAVCRSGASTLAELAAQSKPAVLVPFPFAAENHQEANARVFEKIGCARVVLESEAPARLASWLADLLLSPRGADDLKAMRVSYAKLNLPPPDKAAETLADAIESEAKNTSLQR